LLEWHPELNIDWEALSEANKKRMQELAEEDQPEELVNVKLLPYQRESLAWFRQQEQSEFNGGILADEMGMGKTLQMITLLIDRPIAAPTLVVCPVVAMIQWREEIERYTPPDKLRVLLFHGKLFSIIPSSSSANIQLN
jgi:DNA repair protein RAD16